jgi:hypothetical protein
MRHSRRTFSIVFFIALIFSQLSWSDTSNSSSDGLASLLNSVLNPVKDFPDRFPGTTAEPITEPDLTVFISKKQINALIAVTLKAPIPLDHSSGKSQATLQAQNVVVRPEPGRNVLHVYVKKGILTISESFAGLGGTLTVNSAEFELAPVIQIDAQGRVLLRAPVRCVFLDIDTMSPAVDLKVAHLVQDLYLSKDPIAPLDLSDMFIMNSLAQDLPEIRVKLKQAAIRMQDKGIDIQTSWSVQ